MPPRASCCGCTARTKARAAPTRRGVLSGRGLAYWTDGREERILYVTPGYRLVALNAKTGMPVPAFGQNGVVDLKQDDDQEIDLVTGEVGLHATPMVGKDVVVIGAAHRPGGVPRSKTNVKGFIRGFDVRTGKRLWIFHTIPALGEFGNDTWEKDSWKYTGNAGVWGQMAIDEELNMAYLPVELPTGDYYGGKRPGNNLFGETLVAVDLTTGQRKWHYQFVHHGIWDFDMAAAPILADITVNGRADQGDRAADQAGVALRLRSHQRPAGLADRRAAGGERRRARASGTRRRSRSSPNRRRTIVRACRSTISSTSRRSCGRKR